MSYNRYKAKADFQRHSDAGYELNRKREPIIEQLRIIMGNMYREGRGEVAQVKFSYESGGKQFDIRLTIPMKSYTKKSLIEWVEDPKAFFVNEKESALSNVLHAHRAILDTLRSRKYETMKHTSTIRDILRKF